MKHWTLRQARDRRGLTQEQLEARSGVPQSVISKLENDPNANPRVGDVAKLEAALGLRRGALTFGAQEMEAKAS